MRYVATISKGNNYLKITDYYGEFCAQVIMPFCKANLYKYGKVPIPGSRKHTWKVTHVFARSNHDKSEYRIPASLLKEFLEFAQYRGYNESRIKLLEEEVLEGKPCDFKMKKGFENPREHQVEWIDYQLADGRLKINNGPTGSGKDQPLYAKIKVPGGWKTMGEMKVGEEVCAPDGGTAKVVGVYPQGIREVYRVTFEDGRTAECGLEHLWKVSYDDSDTWRVLTTEEIIADLASKAIYIPLISPPHGQRKDLPCITGSFYLDNEEKLRELQDEIRSYGGIASIHRHDDAGFLLNYNLNSSKLLIKDIKKIGETETQCIAVDHPDHLYITDDFVVTHNTFMALFTMVKLGVRTLITVQPRYITTWINDIAKTVDVDPEDVLIWENSSLPLLGENIEKGVIDPKIIILPMTRISGYLRNTRLDPTMPSLDDIFKQINAGYRIIDEGHESFHEISISLMYGNFAKCLLLSATLKSDDMFTNRMYKVMLPPNIRLKEPDPENYIDVVAYAYQLCQRKYRLKTTQFGSYNDLALEESILKNDLLTKFYYQIAKKAFTDYYLSVREPGTKCLFFFSRINMSQVMLGLFQKDFPELDFATFLGTLDKKDPEKYLKHEIVITTPGSCGTGKDIPGLVTVICFHTVFSDQRNKQMIGRLRDLRGKFDGRITPTFVFPVCVDIPKHKDCFKKREQAFSAKQKTFKLIDSNCVLV